MKREMIIRAWKDPEYRASLSVEEREALPDCPSGKALGELSEAELADAVGGVVVFCTVTAPERCNPKNRNTYGIAACPPRTRLFLCPL